MKRLWVKLTSAFALVIAVGIAVTVLLARQAAATQFAHFMIDDLMIRPERLQAVLVHDYEHAQGWQGTMERLPQLLAEAADGAMSGVMSNMMGMRNNQLQVLDAGGQVVATAGGAGNTPLALAATQHWPLLLADHPIGELRVAGGLMTGIPMTGIPLVEQHILAGLTRSVLVAGLLAGLLGLLLAGWLVRQITQPLTQLAQVSTQIADGNLGARATINSQDEIAELAVSFNRMADSLESQEKLRQTLLADIAHELRTPLTAIQGTVEAVQDGVFAPSPANLQAIHDQVMALNHMVEELRTLASAEAGQLVLDTALLNLVELCQRRVAAFQAQAAHKQIMLSWQATQPEILICGDAQRLGQVLNNLLDNALRHTPAAGAVQVNVMSLQAHTQQAYAQLTVSDTGEGIAPEELPHVFDRFYRSDRSRTRQTGGSGLGLAIVRQLVRAHKGEIWVESPPVGSANGSAFHIHLPLA